MPRIENATIYFQKNQMPLGRYNVKGNPYSYLVVVRENNRYRVKELRWGRITGCGSYHPDAKYCGEQTILYEAVDNCTIKAATMWEVDFWKMEFFKHPNCE